MGSATRSLGLQLKLTLKSLMSHEISRELPEFFPEAQGGSPKGPSFPGLPVPTQRSGKPA